MAIVDFTYAQVEDGFSGFFDPNTSYGAGYIGFSGWGVWAGFITGTEASFAIECGGGNPPLGVVVDGSHVGTPALSSGRVQLFTGLSDTPHLVSVHIVGGYAPKYNYVDINGMATLRVDGAAPAFTPVPVTIPTDPSANILNSQPTLGWSGENVDLVPSDWGHAEGNTAAIGGVVFRAQCSDIYIYASSQAFFYSIDRGTPVRVILADYDSGQSRLLPLVSGLDDTEIHEYWIWPDESPGSQAYIHGVMALDGGAPVTFSPIGNKIHVIQFGNSITEGEGATTGAVDCWLYGLANNYLITQCGVSGDLSWSPDWPSIGSLADRLSEYMAELETPDYALLTTGRNDNLGDQTTFETGYGNLRDAAIAQGFPNVICRGLLPGTASAESIQDAETWIKNVIEGYSAFQYLDTTDWPEADTVDDLHPSASGYSDDIAPAEAAGLAILITSESIWSWSQAIFFKLFGIFGGK